MKRSLTRLAALVACMGTAHAVAADVQTAVSGRIDTRVRSPLPGDLGAIITTDAEVLPSAGITLGWGTTRLGLVYNPSILFREPQLGPRARVFALHRGRAFFGHRFGRANLTLTQEAAYGTTDVGALVSTDGTPIQNASGVFVAGALPYERFASLAMLDVTPSPLYSFSFSGGYVISGSPQADNVVLPLQWGPFALARFRATVVPRNFLITQGQYLSAEFATGQLQLVAQLTEAYEHEFRRNLTASLGAGLALTREHIVEIPNGPRPGDYQEVLPVALASMLWRNELGYRPFTLNVNVRLGPFADRYTALVYERVEAQLQGEWRVSKPVTALANAGLAYAVPVGLSTQAGDRIYYGEGGARWALKEWVTLGAIGRLVWSEQPRLGIPGYLQWLLTFSVTFHDERSFAW